MRASELQSLAIELVAAKLGLQVQNLGAGQAQLSQGQDILPFTINIDANSVHFENEEEGAPIELVMAVRNCDQKEAVAWLKENFGGKKSGGSLKLLEAEIPKVKISQDYIGGTAYYTIALFAEKDGKTVEHPFVITSARELFPCTEEELQKRKLFVEKLPSPRLRWSQSSVMEYVSGAPVPSLKDCYECI